METVNDQKLLASYVTSSGIRSHFSGELPRFFLFHYSPGELLTNPFSPSKYLQFIVEGDLRLYNMPDEESTVMLQTTYNEVSLLGEVERLDAKFTPFFVEARTDVYTLALYLVQYRQQLLNDPVFLRYLCLCLSNKLNGAVVSSLKIPLRQRVGMSLQYSLPDSHISDIGQLANSLNVSSRQLLRVLKEFCAEGILEHEKKGVYRVLRTP